ncbi:MAG: toll/interleukin-1 receptor domain-containing protein [Sphingomonadales bacterium]|nr:toll/interleukin-1 receptor domain-containing protein [Sphingomonadales bacterium]
MAGSYRYKAFISYSHRDRRWGRWLLRAIETYRVPRRLVGRATFRGKVPRRLAPVFRDRDELPAAEDLSAKVREALEQSEFLIIVCSPDAAASRWVNQEILEFKRLRGEDNLLAVIVDGEPFASERVGDAAECFPPGLRRKVGPDSAVTDARAEPVAADLRSEGDGRRLGRLKLVAGMLGLSLDTLIQRDLQRRHRRVTAVTVGALLGVLAMGALTLEAVDARHEAELRRGEAEGLIEFMLTDLRKKLEPVGRLDVLDAVGEEAIGYYAARRLTEMPDDSIGRRARAFHLLGEVDDLKGDLDGAREMFEAAYSSTEALLARDPESPDRIYHHAQSAFWVGYLGWRLGDYSRAEELLTEYQNLSGRLVELEPSNLEWRIEYGLATKNLAAINIESLGKPEVGVRYNEAALEILGSIPKDYKSFELIRLEISDALAWNADYYEMRGPLSKALFYRKRQEKIIRSLIEGGTNKFENRYEILGCLFALSRISSYIGELDSARSYISESREVSAQLLAQDSENKKWRRQAVRAELALAEFLLARGKTANAQHSLQQSNILMAPLADMRDPRWLAQTVDFAQFLEGSIAEEEGRLESAQEIFRSLISKIDSRADIEDQTVEGLHFMARSYIALQRLGAIQSGDRSQMVQITQETSKRYESIGPEQKFVLRQLLEFFEDEEAALRISAELQENGYRPGSH